jgi:hypothetical protein
MESEQTEFKRATTANLTIILTDCLRYCIGFLNARVKGRIYFGVRDDRVIDGIELTSRPAEFLDNIQRKFEAEYLTRIVGSFPLENFFKFSLDHVFDAGSLAPTFTRVLLVFTITSLPEPPLGIWSIKDRDYNPSEVAFLRKSTILKVLTPTNVAQLVTSQLRSIRQTHSLPRESESNAFSVDDTNDDAYLQHASTTRADAAMPRPPFDEALRPSHQPEPLNRGLSAPPANVRVFHSSFLSKLNISDDEDTLNSADAQTTLERHGNVDHVVSHIATTNNSPDIRKSLVESSTMSLSDSLLSGVSLNPTTSSQQIHSPINARSPPPKSSTRSPALPRREIAVNQANDSSSTLFTVDSVRDLLRQYPQGLEARQVCLLLQGKNPKVDRAESEHVKLVKRILYSRADISVTNPGEPKPKFKLAQSWFSFLKHRVSAGI